jgi:purine-binding chemotaxis protein CheW
MNEQYLTFFLRGEEHAVPVLRVREIIEYETVTRVPAAPAYVRGVINLRGTVLPVVDLAAKLGQPPTEPTRTTCIVVVETRLEAETVAVGVLADAVSQVVDLPADAVEPPPSFGTQAAVELLTGMGKLDGRLLLLLDLDRVLSPLEVQAAAVAASDEALDAAAASDDATTAGELAPPAA